MILERVWGFESGPTCLWIFETNFASEKCDLYAGIRMIIIVFTNNSQHDLHIVGAFLCYECSDELKTRLVTFLFF